MACNSRLGIAGHPVSQPRTYIEQAFEWKRHADIRVSGASHEAFASGGMGLALAGMTLALAGMGLASAGMGLASAGMGAVVQALPHGGPHSGIVTRQPHGRIGLDK